MHEKWGVPPARRYFVALRVGCDWDKETLDFRGAPSLIGAGRAAAECASLWRRLPAPSESAALGMSGLRDWRVALAPSLGGP